MPLPSSGPYASGAWVCKLNNTTWDRVEYLTGSSTTHLYADCKVYGTSVYVILFNYSSPREAYLFQLNYSTGSYTAGFIKTIPLDAGAETATIDIDSTGRMWLASDEWDGHNGYMNVRWSDPPYNTWSIKQTLNNFGRLNADEDDICAVTAFGGNKIGVLWSNQAEQQFQFRYHLDRNEDPASWQTAEIAASGGGIADDHLNFAVASDGTVYAAVKTSNDSHNEPTILLLKRDASGVWSNHSVDSSGTRPIALLSETGGGEITVVYTDDTQNDDNIVYKQSPVGTISFGKKYTLISGTYNNATSTKDNFTDNVVILASNYSSAVGRHVYTYDPTPVELSSFTANLLIDNVTLNWRTETEVNNYGFNIEREVNGEEWSSIGFVEGHGNSNSPMEYNFSDSEISKSGKYSYRLKQIDNDGSFEYSNVVTVNVGTPGNYYLSQNYPNPFNPSTTIDYMIASDENVRLKVYDVLGREVTSLVDEHKPAGTYSVTFNADNLPSGVYIYRLVAGEYTSTNRMLLIK
jgi:hypothetical protein